MPDRRHPDRVLAPARRALANTSRVPEATDIAAFLAGGQGLAAAPTAAA